MKERLIFETINCDDEHIKWDFGSFDEIKTNWLSDDCTLPSLDDEVVAAYVYIQVYSEFIEGWYRTRIDAKTFEDLAIAIGLED